MSFGLERIGQISISVKDVSRATEFYRDTLGIKFLFQFPGMAFFDCGGLRLYLTAAERPEFDRTSILYFNVPAIHEAARILTERGVYFDRPPHKLHEDNTRELWMAFFRDSEGNHLALMSERLK